jgi:hypothetical protein
VDSPESTLLVVLQLITLVLTLLLLVGARQARGPRGARWWLLGFAMQPLSQFLRQFVSATWGHYAACPSARRRRAGLRLVYVGTRYWLGLRPRHGFVLAGVAAPRCSRSAPACRAWATSRWR